jgi:hypothetical protein
MDKNGSVQPYMPLHGLPCHYMDFPMQVQKLVQNYILVNKKCNAYIMCKRIHHSYMTCKMYGHHLVLSCMVVVTTASHIRAGLAEPFN